MTKSQTEPCDAAVLVHKGTSLHWLTPQMPLCWWVVTLLVGGHCPLWEADSNIFVTEGAKARDKDGVWDGEIVRSWYLHSLMKTTNYKEIESSPVRLR
jgi:hypothetical protein